ncbi:MAG: DUF2231 domain-containing protein [Chloroflexota bacterium]
MPTKPIDQFVDQQRGWMDGLATSLAKFVKDTGEALPAGHKVMDFLHGVWLGHPLHAMLTDVPVGAWTVGMTLDAVDLVSPHQGTQRCADGAIAIGLAGGLAAVPAGLADWHHMSGHTRRLGLLHALLNATAITGYLVSLLTPADRRSLRRCERGRAGLWGGGPLRLYRRRDGLHDWHGR